MCIELGPRFAEARILAQRYLGCYDRVPEHIRAHLDRPCRRCGNELPSGASAGDLCPGCRAAKPPPHDPGE